MTVVLFDVDGTLVNAFGAGRWALERAFESVFGLAEISGHAAGVRFNGRTDPMIIADIALTAGIAAEALDAGRRRLEETYLLRLGERLADQGKIEPMPGIPALLGALRRSGIPFGLLTGNIAEGARLKLRAAGLDGEFFPPASGGDGAFGSDGPERALLARLARQRFEKRLALRIAPSEIVVIGDAVEDIRAAKANGYRSLAVATGWTEPTHLLAEKPDRLFTDLSNTAAVLAWIARES